MTWDDTITAEVSLNSFIARIGDSSNSKNQNKEILFRASPALQLLIALRLGRGGEEKLMMWEISGVTRSKSFSALEF